MQNLGLCLALIASEQAGIFIVPYIVWHGATWSHPKRRSLSRLLRPVRVIRTYSNPNVIVSDNDLPKYTTIKHVPIIITGETYATVIIAKNDIMKFSSRVQLKG